MYFPRLPATTGFSFVLLFGIRTERIFVLQPTQEPSISGGQFQVSTHDVLEFLLLQKWMQGQQSWHLQANKNAGCHASSFSQCRLWCIGRCNLERLIRGITSVFHCQEDREQRGGAGRSTTKAAGCRGDAESQHTRFIAHILKDIGRKLGKSIKLKWSNQNKKGL